MIIHGKRGAIAAGYVPGDAELKQVGQYNTDKCTFSVKAYEEEPQPGARRGKAHWLNVVCWSGVARYAAGIRRGDTVLAAGTLKKRSYTDKNGEEKTVTELAAEYVCIQTSPGESFQEPDASDAFDEMEDDDDVPF